MKHTILLVEDDSDIREVLHFNLENAGYVVLEAPSAEQGMKILSREECSLILLDVFLPGVSGYVMARTLRERGDQTPIIFLTALSSERNLEAGFESGGDDYITKPFSIKEVLLRVAAVLRRSPDAAMKESLLSCGPLTIDTTSKSASIDSVPMDLTFKEFGILSTLASSPGRCYTREDLIAIHWKDAPFVTKRTVDVHILKIREKLGKHRELLLNKPGFGYYIDPSYKV